jgi:hypothetical protein
MQIAQYLLKSVNLLNLGLLVVAAALILCATVPMMDISVNVTPPSLTEVTAGQAAQEPTAGPAPVYSECAQIAEQNVFHPLRKLPPEKKSDAAIPRPEVILYGTLITDEMRMAYVEDKKSPRTTPGRGKRQIALKKGESLSGYVLKEVERDRIELVKGNDRIVVYLSDRDKARSDETTHSISSPARFKPSQPAAQPAVQPRSMPGSSQQPVQPAAPPRTMPGSTAPRTAPNP